MLSKSERVTFCTLGERLDVQDIADGLSLIGRSIVAGVERKYTGAAAQHDALSGLIVDVWFALDPVSGGLVSMLMNGIENIRKEKQCSADS